MLPLRVQIQEGQLVCPISHQRLTQEGHLLKTPDGQYQYPLVNSVPVLVDKNRQQNYLGELGGAMQQEYTQADPRNALVRFFERVSYIGGDYRSEASQQAFEAAIGSQPLSALCISVGGGPKRIHPNLVNLNIGIFGNVDVVGDAYALPYADGAVDAIYCEAVLEHLEHPNTAVREMFRVLRSGGQIFAATPFLQKFHGYPNHFQNFTLIGHQLLFSRAGFAIRSSGVCVGPTFALLDFCVMYAKYLPSQMLSRAVSRALRVLGTPFRALDLRLNRREDAHVLASSTYVHAVKVAVKVV